MFIVKVKKMKKSKCKHSVIRTIKFIDGTKWDTCALCGVIVFPQRPIFFPIIAAGARCGKSSLASKMVLKQIKENEGK